MEQFIFSVHQVRKRTNKETKKEKIYEILIAMKDKLTKFISKHLDVQVDVEDVEGSICAFGGQELTEGVLLKKVIKPATGNLLDTFRYASDYVSRETAICFCASRELRGNLFITSDHLHKPMISTESADKYDRPTWLSIFNDYLHDPVPAVFVVTDESKRRLWIDAKVTEGLMCSVFVNNVDMSCNLNINLASMRLVLNVIQDCLLLGFSKRTIKTNLFVHRDVVLKIGFEKTKTFEEYLSRYRNTSEFDVALMISTIKSSDIVKSKLENEKQVIVDKQLSLF